MELSAFVNKARQEERIKDGPYRDGKKQEDRPTNRPKCLNPELVELFPRGIPDKFRIDHGRQRRRQEACRNSKEPHCVTYHGHCTNREPGGQISFQKQGSIGNDKIKKKRKTEAQE